jgi:hypothetical protein
MLSTVSLLTISTLSHLVKMRQRLSDWPFQQSSCKLVLEVVDIELLQRRSHLNFKVYWVTRSALLSEIYRTCNSHLTAPFNHFLYLLLPQRKYFIGYFEYFSICISKTATWAEKWQLSPRCPHLNHMNVFNVLFVCHHCPLWDEGGR